MTRPLGIVLALVLALTGCASASEPVSVSPGEPRPAPERTASVPDVCPRRAILPECFQRPQIQAAMVEMAPMLRRCAGLHSDSMTVTLKMETREGRPTCIEATPRSDVATCVREVVARHMGTGTVPKGHCAFIYPLRFSP